MRSTVPGAPTQALRALLRTRIEDRGAILDGRSDAWNRLLEKPGRSLACRRAARQVIWSPRGSTHRSGFGAYATKFTPPSRRSGSCCRKQASRGA